jgi:DNA replication protein DnaC
MAAKTTTPNRDVTAELAYLTRALKAPTLREAVDRLAERARTETWSYEEFLAACLQREVSARESHGGEGRIRAARFPSRKSLEEFDFDHARGLKRDTIAHLGTLDFVTAKDNVVFLGPPGTGKTHLATGIAIRACQAGHRVLFSTASQWVDRLAAAHHGGTLQAELVRLARYPLLVVDEVGYIRLVEYVLGAEVLETYGAQGVGGLARATSAAEGLARKGRAQPPTPAAAWLNRGLRPSLQVGLPTAVFHSHSSQGAP